MIEKNNEDEFLFTVNKKDKLKVLFLNNGEIELDILVDDDEILLLKFCSIKDFRVFCNSITDIIEYKTEEIEDENNWCCKIYFKYHRY